MAPHSHLLWALLLLPTVGAAVDMLILKKWVSEFAGSSAALVCVGVAAHRYSPPLAACRRLLLAPAASPHPHAPDGGAPLPAPRSAWAPVYCENKNRTGHFCGGTKPL